jgi:hypothetical protein
MNHDITLNPAAINPQSDKYAGAEVAAQLVGLFTALQMYGHGPAHTGGMLYWSGVPVFAFYTTEQMSALLTACGDTLTVTETQATLIPR